MERERHSISPRRVFGLVSLRQKESLLFAVAITSAAIGGCSDKEIPLLPEEISGHCNYTNNCNYSPTTSPPPSPIPPTSHHHLLFFS